MPSTVTKNPKKAVNVSIDAALAAEAKSAGVNMSAILEAALKLQLKAQREANWKADNRAAIEESNRYFEEHGSPLDKYRVW